jgi:hypothetical protein
MKLMESNSKLSRRAFLASAAGLAAIPLVSFTSRPAQAADLPHLSPTDPSAKALAYVEDASGMTPAKDAMYKPGSHCANCALFQSAQAKGGYAPCAAFPGKAVSAKGWCHAWSSAG